MEPRRRAACVIWADRRFRLGHGRAFALYVAGYSAGRLWIELLRTDPAEHFFGLRLNVFTSIIVGLRAVAYLIVHARPAARGDRPRSRRAAADRGSGAGRPSSEVDHRPTPTAGADAVPAGTADGRADRRDPADAPRRRFIGRRGAVLRAVYPSLRPDR